MRYSSSKVTPDTHDLSVKIENTETGEITEIEDISMVFLNASFRPNEGHVELAKTLKKEQ